MNVRMYVIIVHMYEVLMHVGMYVILVSAEMNSDFCIWIFYNGNWLNIPIFFLQSQVIMGVYNITFNTRKIKGIYVR